MIIVTEATMVSRNIHLPRSSEPSVVPLPSD